MRPQYKNTIIYSLCIIAIAITQLGCKKLVEIQPPPASITTSQTFSDSADAESALLGIYTSMINTQGALGFGNGAISIYTGCSADELIYFFPQGDQLTHNSLVPSFSLINSVFWSTPYKFIYQTNASIEGLEASKGMTDGAKNQFIGEAKFLRAFFYFYLINLFGDVPLITGSDYRVNESVPRTPVSQVYNRIIEDLKDAQNLLRNDYSYTNGKRVRSNSAAATALLARVYLYNKQWDSAENESSLVINNTSLFSIDSSLNDVFLADNSEAILQLQQNTTYLPFNVTPDAFNLIPLTHTTYPKYYINNQLLQNFEAGDRRRTQWVDSTKFGGKIYHYPFKYKVGIAQRKQGATATEYEMILRLAEQYLIRAEARAHQNKLTDALSDLNVIRNRAGLPSSSAASQSDLLTAIMQERRIELFSEWGNRWFDLKRTGAIDSIMKVATPLKSGGIQWDPNQKLYPIPYSQLGLDPNLIQNPGYH